MLKKINIFNIFFNLNYLLLKNLDAPKDQINENFVLKAAKFKKFLEKKFKRLFDLSDL